jgi:chromosomal replication initiation ATPase DnaA
VIAYRLARELTKASYPAIGKAFARHHTTIMSGVARSHNLIDLIPEYLDKIEAAKRRLAPPAPL